MLIFSIVVIAHHLLVEENELGEKVSVHEAPHLAATPPPPPLSWPPSCLSLPVSSNKPTSKRAVVIVKNVSASVNIAHLPKWKKLIERVRATLEKPETNKDRTKQDVQGKTTDRGFRTLLKTMRENFPDTISTPTKIRGTRKKDCLLELYSNPYYISTPTKIRGTRKKDCLLELYSNPYYICCS
jgi:hypothetical protein